MTQPKNDLRPGVTEPAVLLISKRQINACDVAGVVHQLKILLATREDAWLYRGQLALVVDGYDEDPRELVDVPEVRQFLREFSKAWPYWAFFFNQVDDSIILLGSCVCGLSYPGGGSVEIDPERLHKFLRDGFDGMSSLFEKHGFPEAELEKQSRGLMELIDQAGM